MKSAIALKISLLLLALFSLSQISAAQPDQASQQPNQSIEITKETDRLPFMKSEHSSASQEPSTGGLLVKTFGAMLLIVGLIFFGAWGLKKFGFGVFKPNAKDDAPDLTILSSVSLGSGRTISTVRFGERVLLVGSTAQTFTLLADETVSEQISPTVPRSVADLLGEEDASFEAELELAQNNFAFLKEKGGQI